MSASASPGNIASALSAARALLEIDRPTPRTNPVPPLTGNLGDSCPRRFTFVWMEPIVEIVASV
jgi:hypothetical protein